MRAPLSTAFGAVLLCAAFARAQTPPPDAHDLPPPEVKAPEPRGTFVPVSIVGGLRAGVALNAGKFASDVVGVNDVVAGVDLGLEVGAVVFDHFYGGLTFGGTLFVSPTSTSKNVSSLLFGTELGYVTSMHRVGALFAAGIAYRALFVSDALGDANKFDGPDALFTAALQIPGGSFVNVMPRVDLGLGAIDGNVHAIFVFGLSVWLRGDVHPAKRRH